MNVEKHLTPILQSSWMNNFALHYSEAAVNRSSSKLVFLNISHIHQKTPALGSHFKKFADLKRRNLIRKRLEHMYFPVSIEKFLRTAFL